MRRFSRVLISSMLIAAFAAAAEPEAKKEKSPKKPRLECWVDLYNGEPVSYNAVLGDLAGVRVVYLGERHGIARHHQMQARIIKDLAGRGVRLVLAMEQLEAVHQPQVDRYNRGEIDFDELAASTDWAKRWMGYEDYRGAVEAAREAGSPVIALNARSETIRKVARAGGIDKLDRETRAELPEEIQLDDPAYRRLLDLLLPTHMAATPERLRPMYEAQIARDEQMASVLSTFLQSKEGRGRTAVVLCGNVHCSYGLGTAGRVRRRMSGIKDRIILMSASGDGKMSPAMQAATRPIEITHEQLRAINRPIADYLYVVSRKKQ